MNQSFEQIFHTAQRAHAENKSEHELFLLEKEQEDQKKKIEEKNKRNKHSVNANPETDHYSLELYTLIQTYGFDIEAYEKFTDFASDDYEPTLEIYYCRKNNWQFKIHNCYDVDISEGIFAARDLKHVSTQEQVDFYCDLGCRNTSEARRDVFLSFLNEDSLQEYIQKKYKKHMMLPDLLRKKGYTVEEVDISFALNDVNGYLKLDDRLFVKTYKSWNDKLKTVITNDHTWGVNSSNAYGNKQAYYFPYTSDEDIDELFTCIEAFKDHQKGHIGFYDETQNRYMGNKDICAFFDNLRDPEDYYKECWNTYQIRVDHQKFYDGNGFTDDSKLINKYEGLEIYTETILSFNDASQWSKGENINTSLITFEYDKRKNEKECRLFIQNFVHSHDDPYLIYYQIEEEHVLNEEKRTGVIEKFGTFHEMFSLLKEYVNHMIKIHEIEL